MNGLSALKAHIAHVRKKLAARFAQAEFEDRYDLLKKS